jgi:hypothetical protein
MIRIKRNGRKGDRRRDQEGSLGEGLRVTHYPQIL